MIQTKRYIAGRVVERSFISLIAKKDETNKKVHPSG